MNPRITLAVARRVLIQLRRDHRTLAMLLVLPCLVMSLLWWMFQDKPSFGFGALAPALLALIPFIIMFLVTSVTTLRERTSGTLERLLSMPMGKGDFLVRYALAFGLVAAVQSALAVTLSIWALDLDVEGPVWLLLVVAVVDAVLGSALGLFVARDDLPPVLHGISDALPLSYAVDAMRKVSGDAHPALWGDLGLVAAFAVAGLVLGALTLRRQSE